VTCTGSRSDVLPFRPIFFVGRVANRIGGATASLDGTPHRFEANEQSGACLHGGAQGTGALIWTVEEAAQTFVELGLTLPDGHMGFPGTLHIRARYEVRDTTLRLEMSATTDAPTFCNLAPHSYFNLSGSRSINDHTLHVAAESYLPLTDAKVRFWRDPYDPCLPPF